MTPCPSCHKPVEILEKHLGTLFTCPHCSAVSFINFDGQPELANHEVEATAYGDAPVEAPAEAVPAFEAPVGDFSNQNFEQPPQDQGYEQPVQDFSQTQQDFGGGGEAYQQSDQNYSAEQNYGQEQSYDAGIEQQPASDYSIEQDSAYNNPAPETPAIEEVPFDFSQTLDQAPADAPPAVAVSDSADFSDVTNFANADTVAGPLTYVVIIDGIESSQLLYQLKEAMTDSRFGWDVADLLNQVGGGRLVLAGLTPAKASVLINRIKYLPFKISWRQDVLAGS